MGCVAHRFFVAASISTVMAVFFLAILFLFPHQVVSNHQLDNMPLVYGPTATTSAPNPQRGDEFSKWLSVSVKVGVNGAIGSGTIIYYDEEKNLAYVASCGHLWNGNMSYDEGQRRRLTCKIITWYNTDKLNEPKSYDAKVMFFSNGTGQDTSLIVFQPDWKPSYFPIAPSNYEIEPNTRLHSCGCDNNTEVAHYDVTVKGYEGGSLVTVHNSPRPGRSGGGLMDDQYYVATCWGTSSYSGNGNGYFTPLASIHKVWSSNHFDWLLNIPPTSGLANQIPVVDRNNPQGKYPKNYIPLPNFSVN